MANVRLFALICCVGFVASTFIFLLRDNAWPALLSVPVAGWAVKGVIAYAGTRALGEAAVRYFGRRAPVTRVVGARTRL